MRRLLEELLRRMRARSARVALAFAAVGILAVACGVVDSSGNQAPPSPAQIIADVNAAINQSQMVITSLQAATPPTLPGPTAILLMDSLKEAQAVMNAVGPGTNLSVTSVNIAKAEEILNTVVTGLMAVPLPPNIKLIVAAVSVVLPAIEQYVAMVSQQVPVTNVAAKASLVGQGMTLTQARKTLGSYRGQ